MECPPPNNLVRGMGLSLISDLSKSAAQLHSAIYADNCANRFDDVTAFQQATWTTPFETDRIDRFLSVHVHVYDWDMIGKDDDLGECWLKVYGKGCSTETLNKVMRISSMVKLILSH